MKIRKNKNAPVSESIFENKKDFTFFDNTQSLDFNAEQITINKELKSKLDDAIAELPQIYKAVFILRDIENLSIKETGEILGISENNVKIRLKRARMYLKEYLGEDLNHPMCKELKDHVDQCPDCKNYLESIKKTVILYKGASQEEEVPKEKLNLLLNKIKNSRMKKEGKDFNC